MDTNFAACNDRNENASFVTMTSANQMMPPVALFSTTTEVPFVSVCIYIIKYNLIYIYILWYPIDSSSSSND
jgi:hypothetical protein